MSATGRAAWGTYQVIADRLTARIRDGMLLAGGPLPSEAALMGEYAVSRNGALVREAAEEAGIAVETLKSWRRTDPAFDAAVLTAVVVGRGGLGRMRPLARLRCPGMCESTTGYDFGCRKDACGGAKAEQMRTLRSRVPQ